MVARLGDTSMPLTKAYMQLSDAALCWLETILLERYGYPFVLKWDGDRIRMTLSGASGEICFDTLQSVFSKPNSDFSCGFWDGTAENWQMASEEFLPTPAVTEPPVPLIRKIDAGYVVHYDILGLTYWMLSRQEEVGRTDLDKHGRFPAIASNAYRNGYLGRPIVDEWLNLLGQVIQRQWPALELKRHRFSMKVSHDVDVPSRYGFDGTYRLLRGMAGDLLKRRDWRNMYFRVTSRVNTRSRLYPADPVNSFNWIMDISEQHELTSAFYFISGRTNPRMDATYEIEYPSIRRLMRDVHARGHEIGLHPSYNTYRNPVKIVAEADRLRRVCGEEGILQHEWGGRMHYLRWKHPVTLRGWEAAGMTYDSTLGYADRPGFRCGTCFEYPAFDPVECKALKLRIRPLVAMECSIIGEHYMNSSLGQGARQEFLRLKAACRAVDGCFTLLWHNSQLCSAEERKLYLDVLSQ